MNVPVGESIQMFTALKLLGRETAFVAVTGQDHHIVDYAFGFRGGEFGNWMNQNDRQTSLNMGFEALKDPRAANVLSAATPVVRLGAKNIR